MMKPKRELQVPRPPPLKISQESFKIKKPLVIHLKSPEIIHVRPQDFMNMVQQLTGNPTTLASSKSSLSSPRLSPPLPPPLFQSKKTDQVNDSEKDQPVVARPNSSIASIVHYQYSPVFTSNLLLQPSPNTTAYTNFLDFGPIF